MATSKPRVRAYVDHDTYAKLQFATTRPHVSISDTVNNALKLYLSDEYSMERDNAVLRRLDRMTRENERFNQKLAIQSEAMAAFMLYMMRVTPQLPEAEKAAAIARGDQLFDSFVENLKERLQRTSKSLFGTFEDVYEDVYEDETAFFTDEELDLLHKPVPSETGDEFDLNRASVLDE